MQGQAPAPIRKRVPPKVTVVEVGPRDGLQNEPEIVDAAVKVEFIARLADAGLPVVEATSFVNPKWVPQLADAAEVYTSIRKRPGVRYPVLVPNEKGLERALEAGAGEVAVFASATETFSQRNLNRSRDEAIEMFRPVVAAAAAAGVRVRGYLSMVLGDPWEGPVPAPQVVEAGTKLMALGCQELSLGDTIGMGTPAKVQELVASFKSAGVPASRLAVHFHDTYGQGLANVLAALEMGITIVDSSAGGLGGCPYAESATGNLATEDLVWMLDGLGVVTGVDVRKVAAASAWLCGRIGKEIPGRVARALQSGGDCLPGSHEEAP
ncbi:MAG TPA: hydroxymethylglutaryl-CoA lyase [Actinomycetota bacterium]|nr:hydroxymethylglutaryl-CoA lyase [Actinomycetota bacterium]